MKKIFKKKNLYFISSFFLVTTHCFANDLADNASNDYVKICLNNHFEKTKIENDAPNLGWSKTPNNKILGHPPADSLFYEKENEKLSFVQGNCMLSIKKTNFLDVKKSIEKTFKDNNIHYYSLPNFNYMIMDHIRINENEYILLYNNNGTIMINGQIK